MEAADAPLGVLQGPACAECMWLSYLNVVDSLAWFWLKFLLIFFSSPFFWDTRKEIHCKKKPIKHSEAICSNVNGGLLIDLTPQATISSYCHFSFQNAWILSFIMIPIFFLNEVKKHQVLHALAPMGQGILKITSHWPLASRAHYFGNAPALGRFPYTKYFCV
jgi:hypothetical protein